MERASWLSLTGMAVLTVLAGGYAWKLQQENTELRTQLLSAELEVDALKQARAERAAERRSLFQEQRRGALGAGGRVGVAQGSGASRAAARGGRDGSGQGAGGASIASMGGDGGAVELDAATATRVAELRAERQEKRTAAVLDQVESYAEEHDFDEDTTASLVDIMGRSMEQGADVRSARYSGEIEGEAAYDELQAMRQATQDEVMELLGEAEGAAFLHQVQSARARSFLGGMP